MKNSCTQFTDRECREEDCCLLVATDQSLEEIIEEFNSHIDEWSKTVLTPGTPLYDFQQAMIENVKRYRRLKEENVDIDLIKNKDR